MNVALVLVPLIVMAAIPVALHRLVERIDPGRLLADIDRRRAPRLLTNRVERVIERRRREGTEPWRTR